MKMGNNYFVYDPAGYGFEEFETEKEMLEFAEKAIAEHGEDGEWCEEVENIICGKITHFTEMFNKLTKEEADEEEREHWPSNIDYICNYRLKEIK